MHLTLETSEMTYDIITTEGLNAKADDCDPQAMYIKGMRMLCNNNKEKRSKEAMKGLEALLA